METKTGILLILLLYQGIPTEGNYITDESTLRQGFVTSSVIRPSNITEIKVSLNLLSIKGLNSQEQILKAAGWFTVTWNDLRYFWEASNFNNIDMLHYKKGEVWSPQLVIMNSVDTIEVLGDENLDYTVLASGTIVWEPPSYFEVYCDMEMKFFPFDKQTCSIILTSWTMVVTQMPVRKLLDKVNLALYKPNLEWDLTETSVEESTRISQLGNDTFSYSQVIFTLTLYRRSQYYGLSIILPLLIVSLLSTLVFILPAEGGEKASYSMLVVVAYFIYSGIILGCYPISSGTTLIAIYMTLILFIVASSTLCSSIVNNIHYSDPGQPMSAASRKISNFLLSVTCKNLMTERDSLADEFERSETVSTNVTNSMVENKSNGSLRNTQNYNIAAYPPRQLPPVDTIYSKRNQVRPKSESSVKTSKTETLSVRELNAITLKELADNLDRLFFIMFLVITLLVNFIMILILVMGES